MEQSKKDRLSEIGELLFKEGAFFSKMPEDEQDLFAEGLELFARLGAERVWYEKNCEGGSTESDNLSDALKEAIQFVRGGFNINVNVTPNSNYPENNSECGGDVYDKEEMINDGSYDPIYKTEEEFMYGDVGKMYNINDEFLSPDEEFADKKPLDDKSIDEVKGE